jgi:hypothetical protein
MLRVDLPRKCFVSKTGEEGKKVPFLDRAMQWIVGGVLLLGCVGVPGPARAEVLDKIDVVIFSAPSQALSCRQ